MFLPDLKNILDVHLRLMGDLPRSCKSLAVATINTNHGEKQVSPQMLEPLCNDSPRILRSQLPPSLIHPNSIPGQSPCHQPVDLPLDTTNDLERQQKATHENISGTSFTQGK
jgi:hypothetical protein